ncbi:MAG: hypothetical protein DRR08_16375 [Candidatus Parabeggiatoa sp. nov. 2]|nr:MAG: hypothetical protein B6247_06070 [Beggiatoa sp. 4572_84]RKZ58472.1 MAG: hypothetical protein DRR08_16375 [Gammaproteobacteria bacterium]
MSSHIVAHFNPLGIPDYLKQRPQWIVWGKQLHSGSFRSTLINQYGLTQNQAAAVRFKLVLDGKAV